MSEFDFCCTVCLGFSHCGEVTADGYGKVELADDEVNALVALMRQKGSTDVKNLNLQEALPEVYEKLDQAYRDAAWLASADHWYTTGYYDNVYEYDVEQVMDYCAEHHGLGFIYDEEFFIDEDGELDEDSLWDARCEAFEEWLEDFIEAMNPKERIAFLREHLNAEVDLSDMDLDYELEIPAGIISQVH